MGGALEIDAGKVTQVNRWRESDRFSDVERAVLEYAEHLTATPAVHDAALLATLHQHLGRRAVAELTTAIAWENYRARFNRGYGVEPQGYREASACPLPQPE